jgi:hypothetical protein
MAVLGGQITGAIADVIVVRFLHSLLRTLRWFIEMMDFMRKLVMGHATNIDREDFA